MVKLIFLKILLFKVTWRSSPFFKWNYIIFLQSMKYDSSDYSTYKSIKVEISKNQ